MNGYDVLLYFVLLQRALAKTVTDKVTRYSTAGWISEQPAHDMLPFLVAMVPLLPLSFLNSCIYLARLLLLVCPLAT